MSVDELITVIIPVYNKLKHFETCVNSVSEQSYSALQIIIIDDGSTDGCSEICDILAAKDARIEIAHQANAGVSAARNAGLDLARGSWIAFIDADDFISPYYIEDLLTAASVDCDAAMCGAIYVPDDDNANVIFSRPEHTRYITGREACLRNLGLEVNLYNSNWGKLFRSRLWTALRFPEGKINEDMFISHALLYSIGRIAVTDAKLYAYVQTGNGITRSAFTPRRLDMLDAWQEGVRFFASAGEPELADIARRVYCGRAFDAMYITGKHFPNDAALMAQLRRRSKEAYREVKSTHGYMDCSRCRAFAYRLMFFTARRLFPLYAFLFVRGRWRMYM